MPLPRWLARLNRLATNKMMRPLTRRVPPGAVLIHRGRRSGREYRTPVLAFPTRDGFAISLTYGRRVDWLANVLAAGECRLERAGRTIALTDPVLRSGRDADELVPAPIRAVLRAIGVDAAVQLRTQR
ncbi:MAG: nitroreductase family deazaflavin-dependent oxidoreductase [Acidimicrobiales bacterium]